MYVKTKIENTKKNLLIIQEEIRIRNLSSSRESQKRREVGIESSALAILLYDNESAIELIDSYKTRRKIENF